MQRSHSHEHPSSESLHETSRAIVATAMGIKEISVITSSGNLRANVKQGELWAQLLISFAGCAGNRIIHSLNRNDLTPPVSKRAHVISRLCISSMKKPVTPASATMRDARVPH